MPVQPSARQEEAASQRFTVSVSVSAHEGWDIKVERDGRVLVREHVTDWHRVERRRAWLEIEFARRAGGFAAVFILCALLAASPVFAQDPRPALLPEPGALTTAIDLVTKVKDDEATRPSDGFYPELGHMVTGAGWISLGPGYRHHLFGDHAVIDLSTAISWRAYKVAQARFELPGLAQNHIALGTQLLWKDLTQVSYFGRGPEGVHFLPALDGRAVLALRAWAVFSAVAPGRAIPFYFLPGLGGNNTLRSFDDYRFHDRNLLVVNAESRWALMPHVDAAVFIDAGNVAARAGDLDLARTSVGTGLRLHTGTSTVRAHGHRDRRRRLAVPLAAERSASPGTAGPAHRGCPVCAMRSWRRGNWDLGFGSWELT